MTQPKSKDRVELELFLELRTEDCAAMPLEVAMSLEVAMRNRRREKVLAKRSPRAHDALVMARSTLQRLREGRVAELLPQTAIACLELLEAMDVQSDETVHIVGDDVLKAALAHRLGAVRVKGSRRVGMTAGFAVAYAAIAGGCGGGVGPSADAVATGTGGWGGGCSEPIAGGGCAASSGPPAPGGGGSAFSGWPPHCIIGIDPAPDFSSETSSLQVDSEAVEHLQKYVEREEELFGKHVNRQ